VTLNASQSNEPPHGSSGGLSTGILAVIGTIAAVAFVVIVVAGVLLYTAKKSTQRASTMGVFSAEPPVPPIRTETVNV
jgi:hypothetical protein